MYTSFRIKNFRCIEDMTLEPAAQVNLVAGQNNVGKTALLEALWMHSGPNLPELGLRLARFRGIPDLDPKRLLADLFYDFDTTRTISLSARGDWGDGPRVLAITSQPLERARVTAQDENGSSLPPRGSQEPDVAVISSSEISLEYTDESGNIHRSSGYYSARRFQQVTEEGFVSQMANLPPRPSGVFLSSRSRSNRSEDVKRFTEVELEGHTDRITECLKTVDKRIKRLVILSPSEPAIYADVGLSRLVATGFLGDGTGRFLSMSLAFYQARDGMLLIDEVENGLHHSVLKGVWQNLYALSQTFNVQVFATTHSHECLVAARDACASKARDKVLYHRLSWQDGRTGVTTYPFADFDFTLDYGAEVR